MRTLAVSLVLLAAAGTAAGDDAKPGSSPALSAKQLQAIMPKLSADRAGMYLKPLNDAMKEFQINTAKRQAAFLAQIAQESGELRYLENLISSDAGRNGDNRYRGRGPLWLTGRTNYTQAGKALKLDLENQPELVAKPEVGFRTAGWFWQVNSLNGLADRGDLREITKRVTGNYERLEQRQQYYRKAKEVLGVRD